MTAKIILSLLATTIAIVSYVPYIRDIRLGKTKPHGFSWLIWALLGYIAGYAQLQGGGGVGAAVTLVTATISLGISFISIKDKSVKITKSDWISLVAGLLTIPLWILTKQPVLSVILVSIIDIVGFWPTVRKSFSAPHGETVSTYSLGTLKHFLTVVAQQKYNLVTTLYPGSLCLISGLYVIMLLVRKQSVPHAT